MLFRSVHIRVLKDEVQRLVRVGVEGVDGYLIASEVQPHVEKPVVVAKHQGEEGVLEARGDEGLELVLLGRPVEQAGDLNPMCSGSGANGGLRYTQCIS